MSLEGFLAEVDKPEGGGGNTFVTIAKVRVFFCWQGWTSGQSELFEYEAGNNASNDVARLHCQNYIDSGVNDYEQWPQNGICTHIFGDWVPTNAEGKFGWGDIYDFVKKYESDKNSHKLAEDEQQKVTGSMPFNLVVEGIKVNPSVFGQEQYVKMSQEINQWATAKGKKNKKGYDLRVHIVQHVYKDKAEAKIDAEAINDSKGQVVTQPQSTNSQLSAKAIKTWGTLTKFLLQKDAIENAIENAAKGIGTPNNMKLTKPGEAREFAAQGYVVEESDLSLIGIEEVPF